MRHVAITQKTLVLAVVMGLTLPGCGKKEEKAEATPKAAAKAPEGDKAPEAKKADEGAKAAAPAADKAGGSAVAKSKAMIDKLETYLKKMLPDVEAAKGDKAKLKEIAINFQKFAESQRGEGEALHKTMTPEQQAEVGKYGDGKIRPLMGKIMPVLAAAMAPPGAAPPPGAPPAGAPPAGAPPAGAPPATAPPATGGQ